MKGYLNELVRVYKIRHYTLCSILKFLFQTIITACWSKECRETSQFAARNQFNYDDLFDKHFKPSLQPFSLQIFAKSVKFYEFVD